MGGWGQTVPASPSSLGLPRVKVKDGGGRWRIGPVSSWQRRPAGRGWGTWLIKPLRLCGLQRLVIDGTMEGSEEGSEAVKRATALIEERLAQEEENEVWARVWGPKGAPGRSSSTVKGGKSLAPTTVVGRRGPVPRGPVAPLQPQGVPGGGDC